MTRSTRKNFFTDSRLIEKIKKIVILKIKKPIKTWSRRSTILPNWVGLYFEVHNGIKFIKIYITENMIGHKLGEFSHTRVFKKHPARTATKLNK